MRRRAISAEAESRCGRLRPLFAPRAAQLRRGSRRYIPNEFARCLAPGLTLATVGVTVPLAALPLMGKSLPALASMAERSSFRISISFRHISLPWSQDTARRQLCGHSCSRSLVIGS